MCKLGVTDKLNQKNVRQSLRIIVKDDVQQNEWILGRAYDEAVLKKYTGPGSVELNKSKRKKMLVPVPVPVKYHQNVKTSFEKIERW